MTQLEGDDLASFMNQYPMDYEYARVATELEIKMWIKYNFQDYLKKGNRCMCHRQKNECRDTR
ncbi:hypothetical protein EMGBS15_08510 [Filimonas sp.]|nr:hypothetical protein EMGBS15_08510 [Filimonas sp.]